MSNDGGPSGPTNGDYRRQGAVAELIRAFERHRSLSLAAVTIATIAIVLALAALLREPSAPRTKTVVAEARSQAAASTTGPTGPSGLGSPSAQEPAPKDDGRRVELIPSRPGVKAQGVAYVSEATDPDNVRLNLHLAVPEGRATVYLRTIGKNPRYVYDILGEDNQTVPWAKTTLRRYRSLVVVAHRGNRAESVLHVPTYQLLGEPRPKRPSTFPRVAYNTTSELKLRRLILERTSRDGRRNCRLDRKDRPRRANAQWRCSIERVPVTYVRFRTIDSLRSYAGWIASRTIPHDASRTRSCPRGGDVLWQRVSRSHGAKGRARLRRRPKGGLLLLITYPSRKSAAVATIGSAKRPDRVCAVYWRAA